VIPEIGAASPSARPDAGVVKATKPATAATAISKKAIPFKLFLLPNSWAPCYVPPLLRPCGLSASVRRTNQANADQKASTSMTALAKACGASWGKL
jgi:hypothetical protein